MTTHEILELVKYALIGIVAVGLTWRFGGLCNNVQKLVDLQVQQASRLLKYKDRMDLDKHWRSGRIQELKTQADSNVVSDG